MIRITLLSSTMSTFIVLLASCSVRCVVGDLSPVAS
jgi:hypothetical protein